MVDMPASKALSESLLKVIRQQRHYGVRVIISTQEPTISPRLMDLCSLTIIHRFSSPEWFNVLRRHVTIFSNENGAEDVFRRIANLRIGEALLFAPSTLLSQGEGKESLKLNLEFLAIKIRKRLTFDGGKSVVCL
jgi:DNA helicase HerA-like ATPase